MHFADHALIVTNSQGFSAIQRSYPTLPSNWKNQTFYFRLWPAHKMPRANTAGFDGWTLSTVQKTANLKNLLKNQDIVLPEYM